MSGRRNIGDERHVALLREAIRVAEQAVEDGNHPFGALLTDADGTVLLRAGNTHATDGGPGHAETNVLREAARRFPPEVLSGCTLYTSVEPCCMCAGTLYWSGVGGLVFGMSEKRLASLTGEGGENPTLDLPCRDVFAAGHRSIDVRGPFEELEAEIVAQHRDFWI